MEGVTSTQSRAAPGRSCNACRRRKIRCDRQRPCSYCTKLGLECNYTIPGQDARKPPIDDVSSRLRRIELSLQRIEDTLHLSSASQVSDPKHPQPVEGGSTITQPDGEAPNAENGKLVLEEGDTRYVTGNIWTELDEGDDESPGYAATGTNGAGSTPSTRNHGFPFGLDVTPANTHQLHPSESRIFALWQTFIECVHPVLNLVHVPTTQRQLLRACQNLTEIPPAFQALMFSVYYAAITSMQSSVSCMTLSTDERQQLLDRYRVGIEQSLAAANFLCAPDVTMLQAFTLYLTCARQSVDKTYIWAMTGLLIRLAMKLGLHRDPAILKIPPFMSEMRRRLWWQIFVLDVRTAEENDSEPFIYEHVYDTKIPANVNDSDLDVNMAQPPVERQARTEILFSLVRFEISYVARGLVFSPKFTTDNGYSCLSIQEKNDAIDKLFNNLKDKYLQYCDDKVPISYLTRTAAPKLLAKIKLTLHHPSRTETIGIPRERLDDLIKTAVDIVQYAHELRSDEKYSRWTWLFQKYIEWDAVAFLLQTMGAVHLPDIIERTWNVIDVFFDDWSRLVPEGERRWQRLQNLRARAAAKQGMHFSGPEFATSIASETPNFEQAVATATEKPDNTRNASNSHQQTVIWNSHGSLPQGSAVQPSETLEDFESWPLDGLTAWSCDNFSYSMQNAANWEMDLEDNAFMPPI